MSTPQSNEPVMSTYMDKWSKVNVVAHEQERSAREEYSRACIDWQRVEIGRLIGEVERLRAVLVKSVAAIRTWHNQGIPVRECSKLWDIYWRNAPEMKPIREALTALDGVSK
jgi:hypothetical protein